MSNTHSYLSLVNNSREIAEFTIRPSGDFIRRVTVPPSESRCVQTDSVYASWDVYVTVDGLGSATLTTKNPGIVKTI